MFISLSYRISIFKDTIIFFFKWRKTNHPRFVKRPHDISILMLAQMPYSLPNPYLLHPKRVNSSANIIFHLKKYIYIFMNVQLDGVYLSFHVYLILTLTHDFVLSLCFLQVVWVISLITWPQL